MLLKSLRHVLIVLITSRAPLFPKCLSAKATIPGLNWERQFSLPDFKFETWGMHSFILQVFRPDGTILSVTKNVFVPATSVADEEEPVFEELQDPIEE